MTKMVRFGRHMLFRLGLREAVLPRQIGTSKTDQSWCRTWDCSYLRVVSRRLPHEAVKKIFFFPLTLFFSPILLVRMSEKAVEEGRFVHVHTSLWMVGWSDDWLAPFHRGTKRRSAGGSGRYWRTHYYALGKMMERNQNAVLSAMESILLLLVLLKRGQRS